MKKQDKLQLLEERELLLQMEAELQRTTLAATFQRWEARKLLAVGSTVATWGWRLLSVPKIRLLEICRGHLQAAARRIASAYPQVEVLPVCADFTLPFDPPQPRRKPARTVIFFPGSTIGNFDPHAAIELMRHMRTMAGPGGGLVIGTDLVKNVDTLLRAYNDSAGVTAEFNLNLLRRLNREFGANFALDAFSHEAIWNETASRIEMRLVSARAQTVRIGGHNIRFAAGERLLTEYSHKYSFAGFREQATAAGWVEHRVWLDDRRYFAVHYLEARARM